MPTRKIVVQLQDAALHWFVPLTTTLTHRFRHLAGRAL